MIVEDPSNETECSSACSKFATIHNVQGCCSSFTGSMPTCKFYIGVLGAYTVNNAPLKKAATCKPNPQYVCTDFIPKNHCDPLNSISLLDCSLVDCSDVNLCKTACEAKANELGEKGCCYTFQGPRKVCNFLVGSTSIANNGKLRYASMCQK